MIHDLQDYARQGFQFVFDHDGKDYRVVVYQRNAIPTVKVYDGAYFFEAFIACAKYLEGKHES